jgi:hypothetical protein
LAKSFFGEMAVAGGRSRRSVVLGSRKKKEPDDEHSSPGSFFGYCGRPAVFADLLAMTDVLS